MSINDEMKSRASFGGNFTLNWNGDALEKVDQLNKSMSELTANIGQTLTAVSKGANFHKYWKDQAELIDDATHAVIAFQNSFVKSNSEAGEVVKTLNALKAMGVADLSSVINVDGLEDTFREAFKRFDKSFDFSVESFSGAFNLFSRLNEKGLFNPDVFERMSQSSEGLVAQLRTAQREAIIAQQKISELEDTVRELGDETGVSELKEQLQFFKDKGEEEFKNFLSANQLDAGRFGMFEGIFDEIEEGSSSALDAIAEVKSGYAYLLRESFSSGSIDSGAIDVLLEKLIQLNQQLDRIEASISTIQTDGVKFSGVSDLGAVSGSDDTASISQNVGVLAESISKVGISSEESYIPFQNLISSIHQLGSLSEESIHGIGRIFSQINSISNLKISISSLRNIAEFIHAIGGNGDLNPTQLMAVGNVNLKGFSDIKVSKSSLGNLAEYLPKIASVDTTSLKSLSEINFDNLNRLSIKKGQLTGLEGLVSSAQELGKAFGEGLRGALSAEISKAVSEMKTKFDDASNTFGESAGRGGTTGGSSGNSSSSSTAQYRRLQSRAYEIDIAMLSADPASERYKVLQNESMRLMDAMVAEEEALKKRGINVQTDAKIIEEENENTFKYNEAKAKRADAEKAAADRESALAEESLRKEREAFEARLALRKEEIASEVNAWTAASTNSDTSDAYSELSRMASQKEGEGLDWIQKSLESGEMTLERAIALFDALNQNAIKFEETIKTLGMDQSIEDMNKKLVGGTDEFQKAFDQITKFINTASADSSKWSAAERSDIQIVSDAYKNLQTVIAEAKTIRDALLAGNVSSSEFSQQMALLTTERRNSSNAIIANGFNNSALKEGTSEYNTAAEKLNKAILQLIDAKNKLSNELIDGEDELSDEATKHNEEIQKNISSYSQLIGEMDGVKKSLNGMNSSTADSKIDELIGKMKDLFFAERRANKEKDLLIQGTSEYSNAQSKINTLLASIAKHQTDWTAASKGSTKELYNEYQALASDLEKLNADMENGAVSGGKFKKEFGRISGEVRRVDSEIKKAHKDTKSFGDRIQDVMTRFSAYFSGYNIIMKMVNAIKQMINVVRELDDAEAQLQIVTRAANSMMAENAKQIMKYSKETASVVKDMYSSQTTYARLGYSLDASAELAKYTAMLKNVGDIDVADAQDAITAIIKAFDIGTDDIEAVMDKLVVVGNNFPISVSQLATGMNDAGSVLSSAGNSFEESLALLTAANTTVQNISKSATGLRTIAARLRNTKTELDDLGESMTTAEYDSMVSALTAYNVSLTDSNGELRSTYDVMSDIASVWDQMTKNEQAALSELASGTRQQNVFYSLIEQFQEASGAMEAMEDSEGELSEANDIYLDTINGKIAEFKASFSELSTDLIESELLSDIIEFGTKILNIVDGFTELINKIGGLRTVLQTIGINMFVKNLGNIEKKIENIINIVHTFTGLAKNISSSSEKVASSLSQAVSGTGTTSKKNKAPKKSGGKNITNIPKESLMIFDETESAWFDAADLDTETYYQWVIKDINKYSDEAIDELIKKKKQLQNALWDDSNGVISDKLKKKLKRQISDISKEIEKQASVYVEADKKKRRSAATEGEYAAQVNESTEATKAQTTAEEVQTVVTGTQTIATEAQTVAGKENAAITRDEAKANEELVASQNMLNASNPRGWVILLISLIPQLINLIKKYNKTNEELAKDAKAVRDEYDATLKSSRDNVKNLKSLSDEYKKLAAGVNEFGNSVSLSSEEYERYKEIVSEVLDEYPQLISAYDQEGNAIASNNNLIEEAIKLEKERIKLANEARYSSRDSRESIAKGIAAQYEDEVDALDRDNKTVKKIYKAMRESTDEAFIVSKSSAEDLRNAPNKLYVDILRDNVPIIKEYYGDILNAIYEEYGVDFAQEAKAYIDQIIYLYNQAQYDIKNELRGMVKSSPYYSSLPEEDIKEYYSHIDSLSNMPLDYKSIVDQFQSVYSYFQESFSEYYGDDGGIFSDIFGSDESLDNKSDGVKKVSTSVSEVTERISELNDELDKVESGISNVRSNVQNLNNAIRSINEEESLSADQVISLVEAYPTLADEITKTTDGYTLNKDALEKLRDLELAAEKNRINSAIRVAKSQIASSGAVTKAYASQIKSIATLLEAERIYEKFNSVKLGGIDPDDIAEIDEENYRVLYKGVWTQLSGQNAINALKENIQVNNALKEIEELYAQVELLNTIDPKDYSSGGNNSSDKNDKEDRIKETEEYIAEIEKFRKELYDLSNADRAVADSERDLDRVEGKWVDKLIDPDVSKSLKERIDALGATIKAVEDFKQSMSELSDDGFDTSQIREIGATALSTLSETSKSIGLSAEEAIASYNNLIEEYHDAQIAYAEAGRTYNSEYRQRIVIKKELLDLYKSQQDAQHGLNEARDAYINQSADKLRSLGFDVIYDSENNEFFISNLEHLNDLVASSVGEYDNLQEATNEHRKEIEKLIEECETLNDENESGSKTWLDLQDKIRDTQKQIIEDLKNIVVQSNEYVDAIQNVYDTLQAAADEFAENGGFISVDTFQSVLELGPEYMQYLKDQNGMLVINREKIEDVIKAKTESLALDQAMTYVERIEAAMQKGAVEDLNNLLFATTALTDATWDLVYAKLESLDLDDNQYAAAKHNIDAIKNLMNTTISGIGNVAASYSEQLEHTKDGLDDILEYVKKMLRDINEQEIEALEDQKEAFGEIIDLRKELLKDAADEEDYEEGIAERTQEIAELQIKINQLMLDDSREAQAKRIELEKEMVEKQKDLSKDQRDHAIELTEEQLDDTKEAYDKEKDAEIEILRNKYSSEQKLHDAAIQYIQDHYDTLYGELMDWNYEYGSDLQTEIQSAWDSCDAAVQLYGSYLEAVKQTTQEIANISGSVDWSYGEDGTKGDSYGKPKKHDVVGADGNPTDIYSAGEDEAVGKLVYRMYQNSLDWAATDDADVRSALHEDNERIHEELTGLGINAVYDSKSGIWYVDRIGGEKLYEKYKKYFPKFHDGGIVGDIGDQKQNEVLALLKKGEAVLTEQQETGMYKVVDFFSVMSEKLGKVIDGDLFSKIAGGTMTGFKYRDNQFYGNTSNGGIHVDRVEVTAPIQIVQKLDDAEIQRCSKTIGSIAAGFIQEGFSKRGLKPGASLL